MLICDLKMIGEYIDLVAVVLALISLVEYSSACNGYGIKLNSLKGCADDNVIKITNPGVTLDKDCNIILQGCAEVTKPFKTAKGSYTIKKPPMPPMEGEMDFCDFLEGLNDPQLGAVAKTFNVPVTKCPAPKFKVCGSPDKKINIAKFKNHLAIAVGTIDAKISTTHDTGETCYDANISITRNRSRG